MILGSSKGVRDTGRPGENRRVRCSTDLKVGELIVVNLNLVVRVTLALGLDLFGLHKKLVQKENQTRWKTYLIQQFGRAAIGDHSVGKAQSRGIVLVLES